MPDSFGFSIIVPLVKDRCGDISKLANYRAISLSPLLAKLFESCLSNKFSAFMHTSDLQVGFKKHSGCANAIYIVQQLVQYYTKRGSTVYMSALDASKAFDRINHKTLIDKLISRNAPMCFIQIVVNWYSKLGAAVRWNGVLSSFFNVYCGVRQGGLLSPLLFNLYVDDLLCELEASKLGCCIKDIYVGCVMYADDILLLSASVVTLQSMLSICSEYGRKHDIIFNCKKCAWLLGLSGRRL